MQQEQRSSQELGSYAAIVREIALSTREVIRNEWILAKEEIKGTAARLRSHSLQLAIYAGIAVMSIPPFLAFLVIGLGEILDGRYWLSALILSAVFAGVGGTMAYLTLNKIKERDLQLPRTRETIEKELHVVSDKIDDVRNATKRRAV